MARPFRLCIYSRSQSRLNLPRTLINVHTITSLEDEALEVSFKSGFLSVISNLGIRWRGIPTEERISGNTSGKKMAHRFRVCVYSRRQSRQLPRTEVVVHTVTTWEDEKLEVSFISGFLSVISRLGIRWRGIPTEDEIIRCCVERRF